MGRGETRIEMVGFETAKRGRRWVRQALFGRSVVCLVCKGGLCWGELRVYGKYIKLRIGRRDRERVEKESPTPCP